MTTHYTYDDNDRVESAGLNTHLYDDNGNTLTVLLGTCTVEYRYNSKNQLIEAGDEKSMALTPLTPDISFPLTISAELDMNQSQ